MEQSQSFAALPGGKVTYAKVSKPGAVIEVYVTDLPPHVKAEMAKNLRRAARDPRLRRLP